MQVSWKELSCNYLATAWTRRKKSREYDGSEKNTPRESYLKKSVCAGGGIRMLAGVVLLFWELSLYSMGENHELRWDIPTTAARSPWEPEFLVEKNGSKDAAGNWPMKGVIGHAHNPSSWKAEAGGPSFWGLTAPPTYMLRKGSSMGSLEEGKALQCWMLIGTVNGS